MNCKYMNMLRVVRGNAFKLKIAVEAYTPSGRRIDSFALGEAVLKLDKNGTLTTKEYTILEGTTILVAFDGSESLGVYGFQMSGEYDGEAWRWANAEIFQIVESNVKAHIPEGCVLLDDTYNMALKIVLSGGDGVTFTPSVSEQGIISWTNDGGLPNPEPRNIRGPRGEQGPQGEVGPQGPRGQMGLRGQIGPKGDKGDKGDTGATPVLDVTASVDENVGNPMVVVESFGPAEHRTFDFQFKNLKGQKGETGATGPQGPQGQQGEPGNYTKPASGIPLSDLNGNVASGIVYDVTANNSGATFASLSALLSSGSLSTLIPTDVRKGGMQIRFVQSSDNNYVQYRYMPSDASTAATFTNGANWSLCLEEPEVYSAGGVSYTTTQVSDWPYKLAITVSDKKIISVTANTGRALIFKVKEGTEVHVTGAQWTDSAIIAFSSNANLPLEIGSTFDSVIAGTNSVREFTFTAPQDGIVVIDVNKSYAASIRLIKKSGYAYKFVEKIPMSIGLITEGRPYATNSTTARWGTIYSPLIKNDGYVTEQISGATFACFKNNAWYADSSVLPADCEYFRIVMSHSGKLKPQPIELHYSNNNGCLTYLKDSYRIEEEYDRTYFNWFSVDVALPIDNPQTDIEDAEPLFTNAWIKLPKTYSRFGRPTKMIILCHGTSGMTIASVSEYYRTPIEYFNAQGYAVMDCYPLSSLYPNSAESVAAHALGTACYQATYDYIIQNYNIAPEVCIYAKSAGGISQGCIINQSHIPVRGAAILCPNLDLFNDFRCMEPRHSQDRMRIYNLTPIIASGSWTTEQSAVLKNNQLAFVGFSPILCNNTINAKAYNDFLLDMNYPLSGNITKNYSQDLLNNAEFCAIVDDAKLFTKCPTKIWYAEDDNQVPYVTILKYQKMVQNGNGICILRKMQDGTGGHDSTDASELAETVTVTARDGSSWTIAKGIVEALQWIELFIG